MRLTPPQKEVVLTLASTDWSIRRAYSVGSLQVHYWRAPTMKLIDSRVFNALLLKGLLEQYDKGLNLWCLSQTGRRVAETIQESEKAND